MEQQTNPPSNLHKTFGIISLVLGILAFLFSFVPCLGAYAVFPGVLGIILGVAAFVMAGKASAPKGLIIAALILSLIGTAVAAWQYSKLKALSKELRDPKKMEDLKKSLDSLRESMESLDTTLQK